MKSNTFIANKKKPESEKNSKLHGENKFIKIFRSTKKITKILLKGNILVLSTTPMFKLGFLLVFDVKC